MMKIICLTILYKSIACENEVPSTCPSSTWGDDGVLDACSYFAGLCNEKWSSYCPDTPGFVKDNCKAQCGICGN